MGLIVIHNLHYFEKISMKKKLATSNLYFIAIIPEADCYAEANSLKQYFKKNYNSKASLNSPQSLSFLNLYASHFLESRYSLMEIIAHVCHKKAVLN